MSVTVHLQSYGPATQHQRTIVVTVYTSSIDHQFRLILMNTGFGVILNGELVIRKIRKPPLDVALITLQRFPPVAVNFGL